MVLIDIYISEQLCVLFSVENKGKSL